MAQNLKCSSKKFWKMIRILYMALRKGISKAKLIADLNTVMKCGKIVGKSAVESLVFHHHHHGAASPDQQFAFPTPLDEYEFSCSSSPASSWFRFLPFSLNKRKLQETSSSSFSSTSASSPGFGRSSMVRQLRITDSPFPLTESVEEDGHVDEAADAFIARFYRELKRENAAACLDYSQ